ncbi:SDR family oxidoreductase [Salinisphaera sp. SPP-AMP-43]|uniref:SDR family oxidoreductase n=1 Tax=Salinisphaera sp. SPP-AMP-43 TaxID=3121288 RepID=UPI003C6DC134
MSDRYTMPPRIAITGAGSGLGRALALRYARAGWRVAVTDIQAERARRVAKETETAGAAASFDQSLDVRAEADFEALIARLQQDWGGLDVFINNAGVAAAGTAAETPEKDWQWITEINLLGVARGCRIALPALRESGGHVVNIASFAAIANAPGMVAYNVTKAGVLALSETLRAEEIDHGVGVSVACPAFFTTNLLESFRSPRPGREAVVEKLMAQSGVSAEDVAEQVFDAVADKRFLVLTHRDTRWQYRLKRLQPEWFFRAMCRFTRSLRAAP